MTDPMTALVEYIDARLDSMERSPGTWGTTESLELSALLLLELRTFVLRRRTHARNPYEARDLYLKLVRKRFPDAPGYLMSALLPEEHAEDELPSLLGALRRDVVARLGPEDPFAHAALVIELHFTDPGKAAPFSAACRYFSRLQRAIRAFACQIAEGSASNLWLTTPELRVRGGEDGGILMILDTLVDQDTRLEERAGASLRALMKALSWVTGEELEEPALRAHGTGAPALHEHIARLVPAGRIASVRLGGTATARAPIVIQVTHRPRIEQLLMERPTRVPAEWQRLLPHRLPRHPPRFQVGRA